MVNHEIQNINNYYDVVIGKLLHLKVHVIKYPDLPKTEISERHDQISDLILCIILLKLDVAICSKYLLINKVQDNIYEMNYFARALATHCSDVLKVYDDKLLTKLNAVIKVYKNEEQYKEPICALIENRKKMVKFPKNNILLIDQVRNGLFAHRDGKGIEQNNATDNIDIRSIVSIGEEIDNRLWDIMGNIVAIQQILAPMPI